MNVRVVSILSLSLLLSLSAHAADNSAPYGFQLGSVTGFGGAGFSYSSGLSGVQTSAVASLSVFTNISESSQKARTAG
jgi:hypothetical protein